mmetsp:Transcript_128142/g.273218  ORF Transcript_128142/g.273218 Transcript_128142/m.273218 type:complete len:293 (-) Transcript_128142:130-1008(-)
MTVFGGKASLCVAACFMWLPTTSALALQATVKNDDEELDSTFSKIAAADLPQRPMFLFVHLEKSAGSFLAQIFSLALGFDELGYHFPEEAITHVPENYFVVSSIRNPCSQVLSAWSYCCEKAWAYQELDIWDSAARFGVNMLNGGLCPKFSGQKTYGIPSYSLHVDDPNVAGFSVDVQYGPSGMYEMEFNRTFSEIGLERVNCWVRVETLEQDTRKCLQEYENLTNYPINWNALDGTFRDNHGHHDSCQAYYTTSLREIVQSKNSRLFDFFGYDSCCDSETGTSELTVSLDA